MTPPWYGSTGTCADYDYAPCITNHNWALWNVYDSMYRIVQDQLLRSKALRSARCRVPSLPILLGHVQGDNVIPESYQYVIDGQLARLAYYGPDTEDLNHDCGQMCCRCYQQTNRT